MSDGNQERGTESSTPQGPEVRRRGAVRIPATRRRGTGRVFASLTGAIRHNPGSAVRLLGIWFAAVTGPIIASWTWASYLTGPSHRPAPSAGAMLLPAVIWAVVLLISVATPGSGPIDLGIKLVSVLAIIAGAFSATYFSYGTSHNFGQPLTRLDAVYFTLGMLSTAGAAPFVPRTEAARTLVTVQYAVDVPLTLVVVSLVVARLVTPWRLPR